LVYEGQAALARPLEPIAFTGDPAGDELLNDLVHYPHAFLFGCLVDRQVAAERAWTVPAVLRERLGTFEMGELVQLGEEAWKAVMRQPPPPHRLTDVMAVVLHRATQRLVTHYQSDASRIWSDTPPCCSCPQGLDARLAASFARHQGPCTSYRHRSFRP
jgi:hypothetical protein